MGLGELSLIWHVHTFSRVWVHQLDHPTQYKYCVVRPTRARCDEAAQVITSWRPYSVGDEVACFAREVVRTTSPVSPSRARALLWACSRVALYGSQIGLALRAELLLRPSVIERFVSCGLPHATNSRRRTVRANLRFVGRRVVPELFTPEPFPISRGRSKPPYTREEIEHYLLLCDTQPTPARRMRSSALVCLGAGAGLVGADLRQVRGGDICEVSGVVVVKVRGRHERTVPVIEAYAGRLLASAAFSKDGFLIGGVSAERHNVTNRLITSLAGGADLSRLDTGRLRASWLSYELRALKVKELLKAAGITDSKHLFDVMSYLAVPSEDDVVNALANTGAGEPF